MSLVRGVFRREVEVVVEEESRRREAARGFVDAARGASRLFWLL
jgi:hypothetical protein